MNDSANNQSRNSKKKVILKISLILLVFLAPVLITMLVFTPFASNVGAKKYKELYKLPAGYTKDDVARVVERMQNDQEFKFYFELIGGPYLEQSIIEVYSILNQHRSESSLRKKVLNQQKEIKSLAILFHNLQYPPIFFSQPQEYPELSNSLWTFLYEEFKLTILGTCYKATYNNKFTFQWDEPTRQAARNLQSVIQKLNLEQRQVLKAQQTK